MGSFKRWFGFGIAVSALVLICVCVPGYAAGILHGRVLQVNATGTVLVRHDGYDGMPAMTMTFQLAGNKQLLAGDEITAAVDRSKEPWELSHVQVRHAAMTTQPQAVHQLAVGDAIGNFAFTDQRNQPFSLSWLRGERYAISVIYTRCQDAAMCPLISAKYRRVQDTAVPSPQLVEITLDPTFDTPTVLAAYARTFGANPQSWHLLTGNAVGIARFNQSLGIATAFQSSGILHTERLIIVNADGRIDRFIDDPAWTADDLSAILAQRDSPWRRFALASTHVFTVCGERLGPGGRIAVHHTALTLIPLGSLGLLLLIFRHFGLLGPRRVSNQRKTSPRD